MTRKVMFSDGKVFRLRRGVWVETQEQVADVISQQVSRKRKPKNTRQQGSNRDAAFEARKQTRRMEDIELAEHFDLLDEF